MSTRGQMPDVPVPPRPPMPAPPVLPPTPPERDDPAEPDAPDNDPDWGDDELPPVVNSTSEHTRDHVRDVIIH